MRRCGFTLVELMVSVVIGAMVALTAAGAMRAISRSRQKMWNMIDGAAEVRFAATVLARDLDNLSRVQQAQRSTLVGLTELSGNNQVSRLLLRVIGRMPGRPNEPEGDVYEVEYSIENRNEKAVLFRRVWPNPGDQDPPGGVVSVIAEDIVAFEVRYYDGEQWYEDWSEEMTVLPELAEVNLIWASPESGQRVGQSRLVCFGRWPQRDRAAVPEAVQQGGGTPKS